ncbi:MAG TPA: pseudouridine synthase [Thermoanaerobaculia bacterium]|nr:pseudouridine synthase [Thermoanaerobaculia bacterium]
MKQERLQKIIAAAGFASRREAEEMIRGQRVTVNGKIVTELGTKADAAKDHIKVDGKLITHPEEHRYILLYKPKEVMTTVSDPQGRRTVIDLIRGIKERIYPVGRLDYHSEGLILVTNDGALAFKVSHPTSGSIKTYHVKVRGVPEERLVEKLRRGITIDGKRTLPAEISRLRTTGKSGDEGNSWFEVLLREGRTHQIRKMFQAVGHPVSKLRRVAIGPISDSKLTAGAWRELSEQEVKLLGRQMEPKKAREVKPPRETPKARETSKSRKTVKAKATGKRASTKARSTGKAAARPVRGRSASRKESPTRRPGVGESASRPRRSAPSKPRATASRKSR